MRHEHLAQFIALNQSARDKATLPSLTLRLQAVGKQSLFRICEGSACECERRREKRDARGHLRVSRVLLQGPRKREIARSPFASLSLVEGGAWGARSWNPLLSWLVRISPCASPLQMPPSHSNAGILLLFRLSSTPRLLRSV